MLIFNRNDTLFYPSFSGHTPCTRFRKRCIPFQTAPLKPTMVLRVIKNIGHGDILYFCTNRTVFRHKINFPNLAWESFVSFGGQPKIIHRPNAEVPTATGTDFILAGTLDCQT